MTVERGKECLFHRQHTHCLVVDDSIRRNLKYKDGRLWLCTINVHESTLILKCKPAAK